MDEDVLTRISKLVDEEHQLTGSLSPGHPMSQEDEARLAHLNEQLDQCWDLLRQRRARRHAGQDADEASVRDVDVVEGYQQ